MLKPKPIIAGMDAKHTNRLAQESSPYLLQHAHNPVDWYAWGQEAFDAARQRDRPIFLSVGYSSCYWCHVMERESFENEQIAALMNRSFVNIKVDREERPDVDQFYMMAVQLIARSGGWPMSVFLTPELKPFYGGTYFPAEDYAGRPGFATLLRSISEAWETRRDEVNRSGQGLLDVLERYCLPSGSEGPLTMDAAFVDDMIGRCISDYDRKFGGFGSAPKFPRETLLELLLAYCEQAPVDTPARTEIRRIITHTLEMMARGGIRDQLGGGFHRYSTDERWLVPHFEIMLYDNAMLLGIYAWASRLLNRPDFADVAEGITNFVLRDMTGASGEFYSAFDAEVDGQEGQSYLWSSQQIPQILKSDEAVLFNRVYGVDRGANFADPHHGSGAPESNVLFMPEPLAGIAGELGRSPDDLKKQLASIREKLLAARRRRRQPLLDTKVITCWNALMIRNLAIAGRVLEQASYTDAAVRAARFILENHRTAEGGLYHSSRDGKASARGFLDDYAAMAQALVELHRATSDSRWLEEANRLLGEVHTRFSSPAGAFYFTDVAAEDLPVRQVTAIDSPLPSGNAMLALALLELGKIDQVRRILGCFADAMDEHGEAHTSLVQSAMLCIARSGPIRLDSRDVAREIKSFAESARDAVRASVRKVGNLAYEVQVNIAEGFHIYAHQAVGGMTPTRLSANVAAEVEYPDAGEGRYEGQIVLRATLKGRADGVRFYLEYQACSNEACLAKRKIEVPLA